MACIRFVRGMGCGKRGLGDLVISALQGCDGGGIGYLRTWREL